MLDRVSRRWNAFLGPQHRKFNRAFAIAMALWLASQLLIGWLGGDFRTPLWGGWFDRVIVLMNVLVFILINAQLLSRLLRRLKGRPLESTAATDRR